MVLAPPQMRGQHSNASHVKSSLWLHERSWNPCRSGSGWKRGGGLQSQRPISREPTSAPSGDDAGEGVERQRESSAHVLAEPRVAVLAQVVFGPHRLLHAVARVQTRTHLDAAKTHGSRLARFHTSGRNFIHSHINHNTEKLRRRLSIGEKRF